MRGRMVLFALVASMIGALLCLVFTSLAVGSSGTAATGSLGSRSALADLGAAHGMVRPVGALRRLMRLAGASAGGTAPALPALRLPGSGAAKIAADESRTSFPAARPSVVSGVPPRAALSAPVTGLGLTGLSENGFEPPDVQFAAGPSQLIEMVNLDLAMWSKSGTSLGSASLASFFGTGTDQISDPRVLYDAGYGRWFASILDVSTDTVVVAISNNSDATAGWSLYSFTIPGCPDQPRLGVDDNQVLVSANLFSSCSGGTYVGARVVVISKSDMLSRAAPHAQLFGGTSVFAVAPAQALGSSSVGWMASVDDSASSVVHVYEVVGTPPSASVSQSDLPISPAIQTPPAGVQPSGPSIDTGDNRTQDAVWQSGTLYLGFNDACSNGTTTYSCAAVVNISTTGPTLNSRTDFTESGADAYYPAIRPDPDGNLLVAFGSSSSSEYASGDIAAFRSDGQFVSALASIQQGSYAIQNTRYGDYFGAAVDPTHPHAIWAAAEVGNNSTGGWGTAIRSTALNPETPGVGTTGTTGPPSTTQANLGVAIDPAGTDTTYFFQYGTSTSYGSQTGSIGIPGGTAAVAQGGTLTNLHPQTTYHVRAVATNAGGTTYGPDATFTTAALPPVIAPTMTKSDATHYAFQALIDRFRKTFRHRTAYKVRCLRDSRTQFHCQVSWNSGRFSYSGRVTVWYFVQNRTVYWTWRLHIKGVRRSCRSHCSGTTYT